ncbi:MAG TPA: hypothetical protein VLI07_19745 [Candidatus Binatus sp.]|jgi:hypothetical protein|nr:hypothetical protein [Candidatus Binatus sp.]
MRVLSVAILLLLVAATAVTLRAGDDGRVADRPTEPAQKRPAPPTLIDVAPVEGTVETLERVRLHPGLDSLDASEAARARKTAAPR